MCCYFCVRSTVSIANTIYFPRHYTHRVNSDRLEWKKWTSVAVCECVQTKLLSDFGYLMCYVMCWIRFYLHFECMVHATSCLCSIMAMNGNPKYIITRLCFLCCVVLRCKYCRSSACWQKKRLQQTLNREVNSDGCQREREDRRGEKSN